MLGKLLKYDFKVCFKYFLPMSIFMLLYSCIGTVLFHMDGDIVLPNNGLFRVLALFAITAFFIMIIGYLLVTQGIIVVHFFRSMVTDNGYLTHTLPVTKLSILISKLLSGTIIVLLAYLVSFISTLIMFDIPFQLAKNWRMIATLLKLNVGDSFFASMPTFFLSFGFTMVAGTIFSLSMYFMCIAFGQLMNRHKVIGAFVAYFVIQFGLQIVSTILSFLMGDLIERVNDTIVLNSLSGFFFVITIVMLLLSVGMMAVTHYVFRKKLNLD